MVVRFTNEELYELRLFDMEVDRLFEDASAKGFLGDLLEDELDEWLDTLVYYDKWGARWPKMLKLAEWRLTAKPMDREAIVSSSKQLHIDVGTVLDDLRPSFCVV